MTKKSCQREKNGNKTGKQDKVLSHIKKISGFSCGDYLKNFVQACKEKNRHVPRSKYQPFKPDILYWGQ